MEAFVSSLVVIIGLFATFSKLLITPINNLTITITKLESYIESINTETMRTMLCIEKHGERLDEIELILATNQIKKK